MAMSVYVEKKKKREDNKKFTLKQAKNSRHVKYLCNSCLGLFVYIRILGYLPWISTYFSSSSSSSSSSSRSFILDFLNTYTYISILIYLYFHSSC